MDFFQMVYAGLAAFVVLTMGAIIYHSTVHESAWQRDRDACIRAGGIPVRMHLPDGRMAECAQRVEY